MKNRKFLFFLFCAMQVVSVLLYAFVEYNPFIYVTYFLMVIIIYACNEFWHPTKFSFVSFIFSTKAFKEIYKERIVWYVAATPSIFAGRVLQGQLDEFGVTSWYEYFGFVTFTTIALFFALREFRRFMSTDGSSKIFGK